MINKRIAIKKLLETEFTVYNVGVLEKDAILSLPFLILEMTGERHVMRSHYVTFSISIYAPIKAPLILDSSEKKVKMLLNKKRIVADNIAFLVEYAGSTAEFVNEKMQALAKILEFKIPVF